MNIEQEHTGKSGRFYLKGGDAIPAQLTYHKKDESTIVLDHTEVAAAYRNQDVGYKMVEAAVQYARKKNLKIIPQCPFVKAVFEKKKEYADVWRR